jgi:hypothetical protein
MSGVFPIYWIAVFLFLYQNSTVACGAIRTQQKERPAKLATRLVFIENRREEAEVCDHEANMFAFATQVKASSGIGKRKYR